MSNHLNGLTEAEKWRVLVDAAKYALEEEGFVLSRVPGRGLSNMWNAAKKGKTQTVAIRTTRDRWFAFPPLEGGNKWKTLDDADMVAVAAVDSKDDPENVEVYLFPAAEVRKRFDAAYAARTKNGRVPDNFGMWVGLDVDDRGIASSVGSGIAKTHDKIAVYPIKDIARDLPKQVPSGDQDGDETPDQHKPATIAEVMAWARDQVARIAGVPVESVKLDLRLES